MMAELDRRKSRLLAILLLLGVLTFLVAAIAIPTLAVNRHYDELIMGMSDQLKVYYRVARHSEEYESAYQLLQRKQQKDRRYLQSETESLATAELQRTVKQIISRNKGEVLSAQVIRSTEEEDFMRVSVRIRMKSSLEDMVKAVHALEANKPYLFIDNVTVRSRNKARRRIPSTKEIEEAIAKLDVDMQVSGYMRGEKQ